MSSFSKPLTFAEKGLPGWTYVVNAKALMTVQSPLMRPASFTGAVSHSVVAFATCVGFSPHICPVRR